MVENIRLISAQVVEEVLKYDELIPAIESALGKFSNRPQSGVIQPLRTCLRIPAVDGFLGVMPAYSENDGVLSTKLLTFFPHNSGGLSTHSALTVLFHCQTGVPTAHLVSGSPKKLAILGAGVQARSHFYALSHLYNFYEVTIWNHRPEKAKALAAELGNHVTSVDDAEEAVRDADVIVTATNSSTPVLKAAWVKSGAHVNAVGSCRPDWHEIDPLLMQTAAVYADSKEAALKESGDVIKAGATIVAEIGELVLGKVQPRNSETTVFKSLGIAIEDAVAASLVLSKLDAHTASTQ